MRSGYKSILILLFSLYTLPFYAASAQTSPTGLSQYPFELYGLLALNVLELIIIWILSKALLQSFGYKKTERPKLVGHSATSGKSFFKRILDQLMSGQGEEIDLKHDYDGISELDNKTPQWWIVAFYLTILFGVVYIYRMFVSESMPDQISELKTEMEMARKEKSTLLTSLNDVVDENSVTFLDQGNVMKGGLIFGANCIPCHGAFGEGNTVGPNLTDDYWMHKGGIKDIFSSIKYGYAEKGMKSWKDDFSPFQIAQLASYIKSLHGSNPPNQKQKQGELYVDSTSVHDEPPQQIKK